MSQNAHTLLLFYTDQKLHNRCLLMFYKLNKGERDEGKSFAAQLNVDIEETWDNDWFNQNVFGQPNFIRVDFETSTHYAMPLELLLQLFSSGLRGAALETFHDQVGIFSRSFFLDGNLVSEDSLYSQLPHAEEIVGDQLKTDADDIEYDETEKPVSINSLMRQEKKNLADAQDAVNALREVVKLANETDANPMDVIQSVLLLRAAGKGVLHALIFGVVTILLFKGLWLWVTLTLLLAVILPLYQANRVMKDLRPDADDGNEDEVLAEAGNAN